MDRVTLAFRGVFVENHPPHADADAVSMPPPLELLRPGAQVSPAYSLENYSQMVKDQTGY